MRISCVFGVGIAGKGDYTDAIYDQMVAKAEPYDPVKHAPELEHQASFAIDPAPYYANKKEVRPPVDKDGDVSLHMYMHMLYILHAHLHDYSAPHLIEVIILTPLPLCHI